MGDARPDCPLPLPAYKVWASSAEPVPGLEQMLLRPERAAEERLDKEAELQAQALAEDGAAAALAGGLDATAEGRIGPPTGYLRNRRRHR